MASVYKTLSKKKARELARQEDSEEEDVMMDELLDDADDTSDSEEEEENTADSAKKQLAAGLMPKTRVLMLTSRGVTSRYVLFCSQCQIARAWNIPKFQDS
jgi:ribosome biogenesis protein BRX1